MPQIYLFFKVDIHLFHFYWCMMDMTNLDKISEREWSLIEYTMHRYMMHTKQEHELKQVIELLLHSCGHVCAFTFFLLP